MTYETKNGYVILKRIEPERTLEGFKMADEAEDGGVVWTGEIVAGNQEYPEGTKILFSRYMPNDFTSDNGDRLLVLKADDIVAVLN